MGQVSGFLGGNLSPAQTHTAFDQKLTSVSQLTALPLQSSCVNFVVSSVSEKLTANTQWGHLCVNYIVLRSLFSNMSIPGMSEILTSKPTQGRAKASLGRCADFEGV